MSLCARAGFIFVTKKEEVTAGKESHRTLLRGVASPFGKLSGGDGRIFGAAEREHFDTEGGIVHIVVRFAHLHVGPQHWQQQLQQFRIIADRRRDAVEACVRPRPPAPRLAVDEASDRATVGGAAGRRQ